MTTEDIFEFMVANLHFIIAGVAFLSVVYLANNIAGSTEMSNRLRAVSNRREELRRRHQEHVEAEDRGLRRDTEGQGLISKLVNMLDLQKLAEDPAINKKMLQAGIYGQRPVSIYYFCRMAVPALAALGTWAYLRFVNDLGVSEDRVLLVIIVAVIIGYYLPSVYIDARIRRRRQAVMQFFPDALDMLLVCVEAGTTVEQALAYVADRVALGAPELGAELALTNAELSYLPDRRTAFQNLAIRNDSPGVRSVATAFIQADRYGTSVGDSLRVMAKENRELRMLEIEKKAAALPAQMTLPMIVFFIPILFVVVLGPVVINFMENPPL